MIKRLLSRIPYRMVHTSVLDTHEGVKAGLAARRDELHQIAGRDFILFSNLREIEWRLRMCHSAAQDAAAAWKMVCRLLDTYDAGRRL